MPPKSKKQKEVVQEYRLQAVVLTDSFETRFMPLTSVKPRCLLPLCNVPLIDYTLEFLAQAKVEEVFLICSTHADQIQEYIDTYWNSPVTPFKIHTIMSLESRSVGDLMRDVDNRGLITGDFILITGDVVSNIEADSILEMHKQRKLNDKEYVMTMVLTQLSPLHRTRSIEPATFVMDKKNDRCLYYQGIAPITTARSSISIDTELLEDVDDFIIRNDLIDCHIDICSPIVPQIFTENFDYQHLRKDFVKGLLNSDIIKKSIYGYVTDNYAARVESWKTYGAVSQDIMERWCYPALPDSNFLSDLTYFYEPKHVYKEQDVRLSQFCKIGSSVVIGSNTFIGDRSKISGSVIGRNCQIGNNVSIKNSYIWDNTVIKDNTKIEYSIVASNCIINSNVYVQSGSVLGFDVVIGDDMVIPKGTRLLATKVSKLSDSLMDVSQDSDSESSSEKEGSQEGEDENDGDYEVSIVGKSGVGYVYLSESEDSEDEDESHSNGILYSMEDLYLSDASITSTKQAKRKKRRFSSASYAMEDDGSDDDDEEEEEDFNKEAIATVERAMENNHDLDTALLELNTLRMSMHVSYHEVRMATTKLLLDRIEHFVYTKTLGLKEAVEKIFNQWGQLYKRQIFEHSEQIDLLEILEEFCDSIESGGNIFTIALNILYDKDVLEEEQILKWWSMLGLDSNNVRKIAQKWIEWLQDAESEEDDDDDE